MLLAGQYLGEIGRHTEAADNYVKAARLAPEDFELVFNTANALRQANRNDDAETFYKKAAKLRPNVSDRCISRVRKWTYARASPFPACLVRLEATAIGTH